MPNVFEIESLFQPSGVKEPSGPLETYMTVPEAEFNVVMATAQAKDIVLIGLFCVENFKGHSGFSLLYVLEKRHSQNVVVLVRPLAGTTAGSIATMFPSATWFEREVSDGFGISFPDAFDRRRLFLHEIYPQDFHPLRKSFINQPIVVNKDIAGIPAYAFKKVTGEGVYQIPVGPVHAGIIEPGHFRFSVIGETICNLEVRMFYKHRGIEKLAEGKKPEEATNIAETISGDETVANAVGYCTAVEKICGTKIPPRAWHLRTILLEMERIYSHLGDMAGMAVDVAFARGASPFFILREEIFRQNDLLTGSRFMKNTICPGGLKTDLLPESLIELEDYLDVFLPRLQQAVETVRTTSSVVDRFETTGVVPQSIITLLNITGPAARATGVPIDTRIDHPYGIYAELGFFKQIAEKGDVLARFNVKAHEITDAVNIIRASVNSMPMRNFYTPVEVQDGCALTLTEAARGQNLQWVNIVNGKIDRYKVRTASFCNWQAIEHAVNGNIVPDFPLVNKSLNLSYAGTDL
ncbi:MAG: NADH-quinone oxidoreductase subunit C [Dehalococcoidales bacterium]|nr:NADH-quinone oxidoreductase subunit C [Dehalococcoidales bacterium]